MGNQPTGSPPSPYTGSQTARTSLGFRGLVRNLLKHSRVQDEESNNNERGKANTHTNAPDQVTTNINHLQTIPLEILLKITTYLVPVDQACLSLISHYFRTSLPSPTLPTPTASRCYHWLITCRLERDTLSKSTTIKPTTHLACCWCKRTRPLNDFTGQNLKHILFNPFKSAWFDPHRLHSAPEQRECGLHEPDTTWVPEPGCTCMAKGRKRYWLRWMDLTCMHCGEWVKENDGRQTGCDECQCEICPRLGTPCYERYGPKRGAFGKGMPQISGFYRTMGGKLRIVEAGAWRSYIVEDAHSHGPSGRGGWVGHDVDTVEDE